mmetsp:Transcript_31271/g.47305  ORF Transcript_31271/g.47305 Transcript_31271/m.47305 type:complete len:495 (+) Transcript_31271:136-1620(+)
MKLIGLGLLLSARAETLSSPSSEKTIFSLAKVGQNHDGAKRKSIYSCTICISEDSSIGSPDAVIRTSDNEEWTCGSLQLAANRGDFIEEECQNLQIFAESCACSTLQQGKQFNAKSTNQKNISGGSQSLDSIVTILANIFLFFLVFGLSATVPVKHLKRQLRNKWALMTGICMQFLIMPLMGLLAVVCFKKASSGFTEAMGLTLLVVTSSPGGSYSNWWCSLFNADLALSVAMTAVATVLSIFMLPANLMLYSHLAYGMHDAGADGVMQALDLKTLFISLGVVMSALVLGLYTSYKFENKTFMKWANRGASLSGLCLIIVSTVFSSSGTETSFWNQNWDFYVGVAFPCLIGLALANIFSRLFARLEKPECMAISIECCYQNTGIAMSVAMTMFSDAEEQAQALAVPIFYSFVQTLTVLIYCVIAWKCGWTKAPADERLCVVLSTPYEIVETSELIDDCKPVKEGDEADEQILETLHDFSYDDEESSSKIPKKVS